MPTNRTSPRPRITRLHHRPMQLRQLNGYMEDLRNALTLVQTLQCSDTRKRRMHLMIGAAACAIGCLSILPHMNDCPCQPRWLTSAFTATEFRGHFKFEQHDFYRVLHAMCLTQQHNPGSPLWLRVGPPGKQSVVPSDCGEIQESPSFWYSTAHGTFFLLFSLKW
jgi:hypothetical protein